MRAVVFDFDGVLADSEPLHLAAYQEVFASLGAELTRDDYYAHFLGYDDEGVFRLMATRHGWPVDAGRTGALIDEKARVFDQLLATRDVLYPRAAACVRRLAAAFPLGIASGALKHEIETIVASAGLTACFQFIVAAGDTPYSKPAPDPYVLAARLHRRPAGECVAIEDSRWGLASAKAAGMKCIGITHTYPADQLAEADLVVSSLDELTVGVIGAL
jgi:beta-phosphoglucomutase